MTWKDINPIIQVLKVVNSFYADLPDLVLLWIDAKRVDAEIRWEPADDDVFPHVYGPLNLTAVERVSEFVPDPDGVYREIKRGHCYHDRG